MGETVNFEDIKKQVKRQELIDKAKQIGQVAWDHRYEIAGGLVSLVMTAKTANSMIQNARDRKEEDCRIYDRSAGHYWRTKRKLKNADYLELEEIRKATGCSKGEALKIMGLLKK